MRTMTRCCAFTALAALTALTACSRPEPAQPASTPLPTKDGTIGRVNKGLDQAEQDAAKRREQIERASEGGAADEGKPGKSISSGY